MTAIYRMRSHGTAPYKRSCQDKDKISSFSRMLLKIAHGLCEDEVSQLKLVLLVDNHVTIHGMVELKNGAEVMMYLYSRKLISKTEASFLIELLKQINRVDLATLVENHFKEDLNVALEAIAISSRQSPLSESSAREPYSFQSTIGEISRDSSSTFPKTLCKQVSKDYYYDINFVTDEETLQIYDQNKKSKSYGLVLPQLKEEDMLETPSSQSSQMSICGDDLSLSQDSLMSLSDDEKFSQIEKSAFLRTDDHLEASIA
ncbi:hypothetical protein ACJMK2_040746 [Sinanodonta woodiana]|uniref:DED domain-containing protein n=1 Tax=Sinanodonta woodiana TaxID=1069815 RepID=A0ABD3W1Z4_SINWO